MNLKFCRKCGSSIPKKSKSCSFCGAAVRTNYTLFIRVGLCVAAAFVLFQQTGAQSNEEQMIPDEFAQEALGNGDVTDPTATVATNDSATDTDKPTEKTASDDAFIEKLLAEVDKETNTNDPLAGITTDNDTVDAKVDTSAAPRTNLDELLKGIEDTKAVTVANNDKPTVTPVVETADTLPVLPTTPVAETELPVITPKTEVAVDTKTETLVPSPAALIPPADSNTKSDNLPLIASTSAEPPAPIAADEKTPANPGRVVIVIKRNAAMGMDNKVVGRAYLGDVYTVTKTYGDFLWIPKVGGWISKKNVAPYQGPKITSN